jgi:SAM-dependent methyltransferase
MDRSLLVKLFGFPATLLHGDPLVLDRWLWLKRRLPRTRNNERLLDAGCGSGAFSIGAARLGYDVLGLSWDQRNQDVAAERARLCGARSVAFDVLDLRQLDQRADLQGGFDVVLCSEVVEHIIDDAKLFRDLAACLKPGGRLLLSTPFLLFRPITNDEEGPFPAVENGWHVRRGYTRAMLADLCGQAGLTVEAFSSCSGFFNQKLFALQRHAGRVHPLVGWAAVLPLRPFPQVFDRLVSRATEWPDYSICLEAYKPRFRARP